MDRLAAMEAFVRVAELGSFSEAAGRLRLSKSAVSRQISGLEAALGARLFHRTTRSLTLTEAGRRYVERCTRILADIDEADLSVSLLQAAPRGRLRVNAPMSFSLSHLVPAIPEFLARFPDVEIDIAMNDRFVDLVDEGFDVGVRIGRLEDSSLVARTLAPARNAVCASPAYLERRGVPCSPQDLTQHDCLCYSNMTLADEWRFVMPDGRPLPVAVTGRLRVNNGDALRVACENGAGVAYLPTFITGEAIGAGRLIAFLEEYLPQDSAVHAVYPHQRLLSPKVRAFVDFLAERFGGRPYWDPVSPNSI